MREKRSREGQSREIDREGEGEGRELERAPVAGTRAAVTVVG